MTEQRAPEAVLHVEFRRNPLAPCRPDVAFTFEPDDDTMATIVAVMPFERARAFAGELMIQFLQYDEMLREKPQEGTSASLTARLAQKASRWLRR